MEEKKMGSGFSKMKKQAKLLQSQFTQIQEELKNKIVESSSGNGLVKIKMNGAKELIEIKIKPECLDKEDVEGLEDLIIAAHNLALEKVESDTDKSNLPFHF
jgi:nucleoid-associated protein EbfC